MKLLKDVYDPYTQKLVLREGADPNVLLAALGLVGDSPKITAVAGTAIGGSLSGGNKTFTRSAGYWVEQVITLTATPTVAFQVGETVTEATSNATGVVDGRTAGNQLVLHTVATALFVGTYGLTGGTSGATATGSSVVTRTLNLSGQIVWSHVAGTTSTGVLSQIVSNTNTALTLDRAALASGDAGILFHDECDLINAMTFAKGDVAGSMAGKAATAASVTVALSDFNGSHLIVLADTAANAVAVTLPDARVLQDGQQIAIVGVDAETNAITVVSPIAAQTLDGTDISSGGTPLATIDADGDYIIVQKTSSNVWVTAENGIS